MTLKRALPDGRKKEVACAGKCNAETQHSILADIEDEIKFNRIDFYHHYQVIQCDGCQTLSFRKSSYSSEDYLQVGENEYELDERVNLFPARVANSRGLGTDTEYLPEPIDRLYDETRGVLLNGLPVLTGIGLRALVESICKEKKVKGENLKEKIDELANIRVLNEGQQTILQLIRTLGNKAAHEVKPHSAEQLALAMDVVELLLDEVYIMPKKIALVFKGHEPKLE
jgi:hypothetical protein